MECMYVMGIKNKQEEICINLVQYCYITKESSWLVFYFSNLSASICDFINFSRENILFSVFNVLG